MLPPNDSQFAEESKGDKGIGSANSQEACDLLNLAQTSLQLSCNVICKEIDIWSYTQPLDDIWPDKKKTHLNRSTDG